MVIYLGTKQKNTTTPGNMAYSKAWLGMMVVHDLLIRLTSFGGGIGGLPSNYHDEHIRQIFFGGSDFPHPIHYLLLKGIFLIKERKYWRSFVRIPVLFWFGHVTVLVAVKVSQSQFACDLQRMDLAPKHLSSSRFGVRVVLHDFKVPEKSHGPPKRYIRIPSIHFRVQTFSFREGKDPFVPWISGRLGSWRVVSWECFRKKLGKRWSWMTTL